MPAKKTPVQKTALAGLKKPARKEHIARVKKRNTTSTRRAKVKALFFPKAKARVLYLLFREYFSIYFFVAFISY